MVGRAARNRPCSAAVEEDVQGSALPSCPGHDLWRRDFEGSASIFSIVFDKRYGKSQVASFIDALELFRIGFSWGGVASLAVSFPGLTRPDIDYEGRLVRLNIGLEEVTDLRADLEAALEKLESPISPR